MCGFLTVFASSEYTKRLERDKLLLCRDLMTQRGPDAEGEWVDDSLHIWMGHRRLAIIDPDPRSDQPMTDEKTGATISFNGEIYNYKELRIRLEKLGHVFKTQSDTEVLLALWTQYREEMTGYLRGMFAFTIWDEPTRRLFVARDPYGIKPVYWMRQNGCYYIASQVKVLRKMADDLTLDEAAKTSFYIWGHIPEPMTLFKSIRQLEAGHWMLIETGGKVTKQKYFDLKEAASGRPCEEKHIGRHITESLRCHFESDVKVGLFLSSGIDSAGLLARAVKEGLPCTAVTLGFEEFKGTDNDEVPGAKLIAEKLGVEHHIRYLKREEFLGSLDYLFKSMDQPTVDGVNTFFVSLAAKEAGLKTVLSGVGGDELFAGYPTFTRIPFLLRLRSRLKVFPWLLPAAAEFYAKLKPGIAAKARHLKNCSDLKSLYMLLRCVYLPHELGDVMTEPEIKEGLAGAEDGLFALNTLGELPAHLNAAVSLLESGCYLRNQLLRDSDWAGMAHSVEIRTPLTDSRLWNSLYPLTAEGTLSKTHIWSDVAELIPDVLKLKKKTGFTLPMRQWLSQASDDKNTPWAKTWSKEVMKRYLDAG